MRLTGCMDPWTYDPWTGGELGIPEWADDSDPEDDLPFQRVWPTSLAEAMLCLSCSSKVDWRSHRDARTHGFICPTCGADRPSHNARKAVRNEVGERDNWICHRCCLPIDRALPWPHLLCAVADHHPVRRDDGGPAILANLRIAHHLCNGNTAGARRRSWQDYPPDQRQLLETIVRLPLDENGHVRPNMERS